jgi:quinol monooxygenase YgiN
MYELYSDAEAQAAHSSNAATAQLRASLTELLAEPLSVLCGPVHQDFGLPAY